METPIAEINFEENLMASPSERHRIQFENLDEIKTSLRNETMSDLSKSLAENQTKTENVLPTTTSTPVKAKTTTRKSTPLVSRNN